MDEETHARDLFSLSRLVQSKKGTESYGNPVVMTFAVVSEPPPERPEEACVDLCMAELKLEDLKEEGLVRIPMRSFEDGSQEGWGELELEWSGLAVIEKALVMT